MTIRNPAPHDRFFNSKLTDTSHFEDFDIQHVKEKFESIEPWLAERLGKAISQRRQYLRYRRVHRQKLAQGLDKAHEPEAEGEETLASSLPGHLKDDADRKEGPQPVMTFAENRSEAGMSATSYATTSASEGNIRVPKLPRASEVGPFECPLCYMIIQIEDRASWK